MGEYNGIIMTCVTTAILNGTEISSSSDSDSEEAIDVDENNLHISKSQPKVRNYFPDITGAYFEDQFRSHFRLNRTSVRVLMEMLDTDLKLGSGRPSIDLEKSVLIFLWMVNQESFRCIGDRFGVDKGHAHTIFIKLCVKVSALIGEFIRWPTSENEINTTIQEFAELRVNPGVPGIIGCIDGTHMEIPKPKNNNTYYNRNKYHSIVLMAVCNASYIFTDVYVGWPGSVHDARIWQQSPLYTKINLNPAFIREGTHILGDTAFPVRTFMMTPYKDNGYLQPKHKNFNKLLSSKRVVIENAFSKLKQRMRRLKYLDMKKLENIKFVVISACILHNIVIWQGQDESEETLELDAGLIVPQDHFEDEVNNLEAGRQKRDQIANMLFHEYNV